MRHRIFFVFIAPILFCLSFANAQTFNRHNNNNNTNNGAPTQGDWMSQASDTDSVVLQLDSDPNYGRQFETQTLVALLKSGALIDPAIEKSLGISASDGRKYVNIDAQVTGNRFVQMNVAIKSDIPNAKPGQAKLLSHELTERLRIAVQQSAAASNAAMDARKFSLKTDLEKARDRLAAAQKELRAGRANNPNINGNYNNGNGRYAYDNLVQQKQQTEIQLIGLRARLKALSELQPATQPANPPAISPANAFQKLIDIRQQRIDALKADKATESQIADAELSLAEAKALADAMGSLSPRNLYPNYNNNFGQNELPQLRANIAENEARLAGYVEQLKTMGPPATNPTVMQEDLNTLQMNENRARSEVDNLESLLNESRRNNRIGFAPTLTVLDGHAAPATKPDSE